MVPLATTTPEQMLAAERAFNLGTISLRRFKAIQNSLPIEPKVHADPCDQWVTLGFCDCGNARG